MSPPRLQTRRLSCSACGADYELSLTRVVCDCGSPLDLSVERGNPLTLDLEPGLGFWRYRENLAVESWALETCDLGAGVTPVLALGEGVFAKCDFMLPTGSFKDRGAWVTIAFALELGAREVVVDSSGNAAAAIAAHSARAGIAATVVVPSGAPEFKLAQARAYGARLLEIHGPRERAAETAREMAGRPGCYYASHVYSPFFTEGTSTWALEVIEQSAEPPETVVIPVGNGSLVLGAYEGFRRLMDAGRLEGLPRIVAVQSERCAPLAGWEVQPSAAGIYTDGIAIFNPARRGQINEALRATGGEVVVVRDEEVVSARQELAHSGLWVEPTAASAWAAAKRFAGGEKRVLVNLGGAGYKAP